MMENKTPKVSVIMPAYNAEKYIAEAIDSVLEQTFRDFELIIFNDCSRDNTEKIILAYDDPRIVYLKNEENLGVARTLNKGLAAVGGEYVARMDADDVCLPQRFEKQVQYLDSHPDVAVVASALECFGEDIPTQRRDFFQDSRQLKVDLLFACAIAHPTVMMRRQTIQRLGGYDAEYEGLEDYELWCRVCRDHEIAVLPEVLFRYRIHGNQVTKNPSAKYQMRLHALKVRQLRQLGMDPEGAEVAPYYQYCNGVRAETAEQIQAMIAFFEAALEANEKNGLYDRQKLRSTFQAVAVPATAKLPRAARMAIVRQSTLFCRRDVAVFLFKKKLRNLLGRG